MTTKAAKSVAHFTGQFLAELNVVSALPPVAEATEDGAAAAAPAVAGAPSGPLVATHDGNFHCDEALAIGLLRHTKQYRGCSVVRTRNPALIARCSGVVDVGAVYDHARGLYDHHQKEFTGTMQTARREFRTRLSSAGLVYKHFGTEIIAAYADFCVRAGRLDLAVAQDPATAPTVFDALYKGFVEHIDGGDNGVEPFQGGTKNYSVSSTLPARVGALFPRWNEPRGADIENEAFVAAVRLATTEFFLALDFYLCGWWPGRSIVEAAVANAASVHASGRIIRFGDGLVPPWKDHLYDIERERGIAGRILFVLLPDDKANWRVMCVSEENASFTNRQSLLWKGLRDDELSAASGIPGGIFVHVTGFIGGNRTHDGALAMAVKSLEAA
jgi:uncharacterized UPF0160 family protein